MSKAGDVIILIGRQGAGKTPTAKMLMEKSGMRKRVVYDPRGEYNASAETLFTRFNVFMQVLPEIKGSFIVIEEATGFISAFKESTLTDIIVGIQHKKNILVLIFHSIVDVPKYVLRLSRWKYLLPTNDDLEEVRRSRPSMYRYLLKVRQDGKPRLIDSHKEINFSETK